MNNLLRSISYNKYAQKILKKILRIFLRPFFNKTYLKGRYFDQKMYGWVWALKSAKFKILGFNRHIPFPIDPTVKIHNPKNIVFENDDLHIFQSPGCYYNNFSAKIFIGKGVYIAPNVGIITANHNFNNLDEHALGEDVIIGDNSWIGMNSVIMPGVILGEKTIVGAGSIVTKKFPEGNCVIAGNPAKVIKKI